MVSCKRNGKFMELNGNLLSIKSDEFAEKLNIIKSNHNVNWYPYGILYNFHNLKSIFNEYPLDTLTESNILDCGAADGDLGFFLESLGFDVQCVENRTTNFNRGIGIETLKNELKSNIEITFADINSSSNNEFQSVPQISLTFFLGIFYHLPNPLLALEQLSTKSKYLILSTRIAKFIMGVDVSQTKVAYLVSPDELNNDDSNWWIYSRAALFEAFNRTGWEVLSQHSVGDLSNSNPTESEHDERIYLLLKSKRN